MKQRITSEQVSELTEKQKKKLRERWKPETYDIVIDDNNNDYVIEVDKKGRIGFVMDNEGIIPPQKKIDFLPLLSVGQMIELLDEEQNFYKLTDIIRLGPYSLCDNLWQEVKAVL